VKKKKRMFNNWCMLILLIGSYLQFTFNFSITTHAQSNSDSRQTLIDTEGLQAEAEIKEVAEGMQLVLHYQKEMSEKPEKLKIKLQADEKNLSTADIQNESRTLFEGSEDQTWIVMKDFTSEKVENELVFILPKSSKKVTVSFQMDALDGTSVKSDLLPESVAKDIAIQLSNVKTAERTLLYDADSSGGAEVTDNDQHITESSENTVKNNYIKAISLQANNDENDVVQKPLGEEVPAVGLKLSTTSFADLKISVDNRDGVNSYVRSKSAASQLPAGTNYDQNDRNSMLTYSNGLYEPGSSARVVVFDHSANGELHSVIQADYDKVGTAIEPSGQAIQIGAYVEISNLHLRDSDWRGGMWQNEPANAVGIDFSNNFYSGISLANIKYFDWKVIFYDTTTHQPIYFETVDDSYAQLTFTSLNPGEFVNKFSTADNNPAETPIEDEDGNSFVEATYFNDDTLIPGGQDSSNSFVWPQNGDKNQKGHFGYTAHVWGDFNAGAPSDEENDEWNDHIGSATFGRGAVGYKLSGTIHEFTRGTYSQNPATWLANASGSVNFIVPTNPPLFNVKKVSAQAVAGGGSQTPDFTGQTTKPSVAEENYAEKLKDFKASSEYQAFAASWVPNAESINEQNVNELAETHQPIYYYVSQGLYSLVGDAIIKPSKITFEDTLPEGISPKDVKLYNTDGQEIQTANKMIQGQKVSLTLASDEISQIPFNRGYITVRIEADLTKMPKDLNAKKVMVNSGTFKMMDSKDRAKYDEMTNIVTVNETPPKPADIPLALIKKSDVEHMDLKGAKFELLKNGEVVATAVTDSSGQVNFEANGQPYRLTAGNYSIKETNPIAGHEVDKQEHFFRLDENLMIACKDGSVTKQDDRLIFTNTNYWKTTDLRLAKTNEQGTGLAGATFCLSGENLDSGEVTSDKQGVISFENVDLRPGETYTLEEVKVPAGYFLSENPTWKLSITADGRKATLQNNVGNAEYSDTQHIVFDENGNNQFDFSKNPLINEKQTVNLSVFKEEAITKKRLSGAVFALTSKDHTVEQTSDSDGIAKFNNLDIEKTYTLKETKAPDGYIISQQIYTLSFDKNTGNWLIQGGENESKISCGNDKELELSITVANEVKTPLPHTGGIGKGIFMLLGFLLFSGTALWFYRTRMKQEVA
jgi:LPXTG-motif cell wall-anchored protein